MCERQAIDSRRKGKDTEDGDQSNREMLCNSPTILYQQDIHLATGSKINDDIASRFQSFLVTEVPPRSPISRLPEKPQVPTHQHMCSNLKR